MVWHQTTGSPPVSTARRTSLGPGVASIKTTTLLSLDEVNSRLGGGGGEVEEEQTIGSADTGEKKKGGERNLNIASRRTTDKGNQ